MPTKSFLSSTAAGRRKQEGYLVKPKQLWRCESSTYIRCDNLAPLSFLFKQALSLSCCHIFCLSLRVPAFCTNLCDLPLCFPSVYFSRHRSISSCTSSALKPLHYIDAVYCCQFYPFQISHPICLYLILLLTGFPQHLHLMAYVILHESTYHLFSHCQRVSSG